VRHNFLTMETYTPQLIAAIKATLKGMT
jgi:hypothetical protein